MDFVNPLKWWKNKKMDGVLMAKIPTNHIQFYIWKPKRYICVTGYNMLGNINKVSLFYVTYEIELDDQQQTT